MRPSLSRSRGQAAVETALILPLTLFLVLGVLQLFLLLQARLLAEYAAFRSARGASVAQGSCPRMLHAALLSVLPSFARTDSPEQLAAEFAARKLNRFDPSRDQGHDGEVVWLDQERPRAFAGADQPDLDDPDAGLERVVVHLVFWYPMRIPFANQVMAQIFLATFELHRLEVNPLMPGRAVRSTEAHGELPGRIAEELAQRIARRQYAFPLQATWAMRRMTPARAEASTGETCR